MARLTIYDRRERALVRLADTLLWPIAIARRVPLLRDSITGVYDGIPRRILCLRLERIGDLLMTLPALAELRALAKEAEKLRLKHEEKERVQQEAELRKKREAYLLTLAADFDRHWNTIHQHAERGTASGYDEAKRSIVDLADAYALSSNREAFDNALRRFMVRHAKRGALVRRLVEAGLWEK